MRVKNEKKRTVFIAIHLCKEKDSVKKLSNFENLLRYSVIFINIFYINNFYFLPIIIIYKLHGHSYNRKQKPRPVKVESFLITLL